MTESDLQWHPLFPPSDDDADDPDAVPPDIQEIHVQRKENGRLYTAPRVFLPAELTSVPALYAEFGGGEYHLLARNARKVIVRRCMHTLPGPSKPMFDDSPLATPKAAPSQVLDPMQAMMSGGGPQGGIMGVMMMMMQGMMQQASQASERQTQMMIAMMQTSSTGSQAQVASMQANMQAQAERDQRDKQSQIELMLKLTEARGAGNSTGGEESFFKGVEFMRHFATTQLEAQKLAAAGGSKDGFDLEGVIGTVLEALQGFNAFREMSGGGVPGAPAVPAAVA